MHISRLFLIIDLLPFVKLFKLLTIKHCSSKRRIIFVPLLLKLSHIWLFYNFHGCTLPAVELDNTIRFSTLSRMSGFLWHHSTQASWFGCFLQYMSGLEVLAFKPILNQSTCSSEPYNFLLKTPTKGPRAIAPSSIDACSFPSSLFHWLYLLLGSYLSFI